MVDWRNVIFCFYFTVKYRIIFSLYLENEDEGKGRENDEVE